MHGRSFSSMAKRCCVVLLFLCTTILISGCKQEAVYDLEKFKQVKAYVKEILSVIEDISLDFEIWDADLLDEEKKGWLLMDAEWVGKINDYYLTADFPSYEEIETWLVPVSDGEKKWIIHGDKLAPALEKMKTSSKNIVTLLNAIGQSNDEITLRGKRDEIAAALNELLEAAEQLNKMFIKE